MVVMSPRSMPKLSLSTLASGARQFVVQDALLMIVCEPSYFSWLTPMTMVRSSPVAGAEMTTFLAPPASTCLRASSALVKKPVDSTTTSTPRSPHGRLAGSRSERTFMVFPAILMPSPSAATSSDSTPRMLSYLSRCARTSGLVRSLTATISMSLPLAAAARQKLRPMRPNPLMPTRTVTADLHLLDWAVARSTARARGRDLRRPYRPASRSSGRGSRPISSASRSGHRHTAGRHARGDGGPRGPLLGQHVPGDDDPRGPSSPAPLL